MKDRKLLVLLCYLQKIVMYTTFNAQDNIIISVSTEENNVHNIQYMTEIRECYLLKIAMYVTFNT